MNFIKFKLLLILSVFILGPHYVNADHHEKIKILYMGGRDHDWKGYYESIVPLFKKQEDFELIFSNKLDDLKAENIKKYDVVLFFVQRQKLRRRNKYIFIFLAFEKLSLQTLVYSQNDLR